MKNVIKGLAISMLALSSQVVFAAADCPKAPKEQWMSELEIQKKIVNEYGFSIKKFKIDGDCYEIYGYTYENGADQPTRAEIYFNPVTGAIVKRK